MEGIFFAIVLLVGVVRALYRFFQWVARSVKGTSVPASARLPAVRAPAPLPAPAGTTVPKGLSLPRSTADAPRPPSRLTTPQLPRRPDAGGPAVVRETSREEFQRQEDEALADEPRSLQALDSAPPSQPATPRRPFALLSTPNDLVRAVILQQALGPPRSRRPR